MALPTFARATHSMDLLDSVTEALSSSQPTQLFGAAPLKRSRTADQVEDMGDEADDVDFGSSQPGNSSQPVTSSGDKASSSRRVCCSCGRRGHYRSTCHKYPPASATEIEARADTVRREQSKPAETAVAAQDSRQVTTQGQPRPAKRKKQIAQAAQATASLKWEVVELPEAILMERNVFIQHVLGKQGTQQGQVRRCLESRNFSFLKDGQLDCTAHLLCASCGRHCEYHSSRA